MFFRTESRISCIKARLHSRKFLFVKRLFSKFIQFFSFPWKTCRECHKLLLVLEFLGNHSQFCQNHVLQYVCQNLNHHPSETLIFFKNHVLDLTQKKNPNWSKKPKNNSSQTTRFIFSSFYWRKVFRYIFFHPFQFFYASSNELKTQKVPLAIFFPDISAQCLRKSITIFTLLKHKYLLATICYPQRKPESWKAFFQTISLL